MSLPDLQEEGAETVKRLLLATLLMLGCSQPCDDYCAENWAPGEKAEVTRLMRYHGIERAWAKREDGKIVHYFERDGQTIKMLEWEE